MTNIEWNPILHVLRRGAAIAIILFVLFGVFPSLYFVHQVYFPLSEVLCPFIRRPGLRA